MAKVPIAQLVTNLIEPVLVAEGLELVDVEYKKEGKNWVLRIYIDKEKGVTVEDCQNISRLTGDLIEVEETIKTPFNLEVSSPGLDRSLKREKDFLKFKAVKKYTDQLHTAKSKTGEMDAIKVYNGTLNGKTVILAIMNFRFIGGSMGSVVGESVSRAIQKAGELKVPFLLVCASGGARMQEGAISLMQLAKTSTQLAKFAKNGGLFIPILTDPTTGGVTASYGMLGDIILAEPGALIGFAGPRVIKQTIGQDLPKGFQRSEFLLEKGFIDHIVSRSEMKEKISTLISLLV